MPKLQRHIFTCVHKRPEGGQRGCCTQKGSERVLDELKGQLHERGFKRIVRANATGCLNQCAQGVTMVVYPEGVWYGGVQVEDVEEIIERHIVAGEIVERLRIPEGILRGDADCGASAEASPPEAYTALKPLVIEGLPAPEGRTTR